MRMNWAWATSIEQLWRSPSFPIWLTLAAAAFFAVILLVTLLRADRSLANGVLAVISLLAIAVAVAATLRGSGLDPGGGATRAAGSPPPPSVVAMPGLACIDELADDTVLAACERALFGAPEAVAAAVSYTSARITRLTALGDVATANKNMTPEIDSLRRSIERDRYGLVAYVLAARDRCQANDCPAFRSLTDHNQISANMDGRVYEATVQRHAASWNEPSPAPSLAGLPPTTPSGKPTTADFPTANSIPPVTIMTETPPAVAPAAPKPSSAAANPAAAKPSAALPKPPPSAANAHAAQTAGSAAAAAKKPPASKQRPVAPVQLAPAAPTPDNE